MHVLRSSRPTTTAAPGRRRSRAYSGRRWPDSHTGRRTATRATRAIERRWPGRPPCPVGFARARTRPPRCRRRRRRTRRASRLRPAPAAMRDGILLDGIALSTSLFWLCGYDRSAIRPLRAGPITVCDEQMTAPSKAPGRPSTADAARLMQYCQTKSCRVPCLVKPGGIGRENGDIASCGAVLRTTRHACERRRDETDRRCPTRRASYELAGLRLLSGSLRKTYLRENGVSNFFNHR